MIRIDEINKAYERLKRSDVHYRFVIDMSSLTGPGENIGQNVCQN